MKFLLILIAAFSCVLANSLRCYDCDPTFDGKCVTPEQDNVKITLCDEDPGARRSIKKKIEDIDKLDIEPRVTNSSDLEYECFSFHYETDSEDEKPGVYRGCIERSIDVLSSCEYLQERLDGGNITLCKTCASDKCNTEDVGGGASALTVSLGIVILNLIICLNVFAF